jgi:hypothetical protein
LDPGRFTDKKERMETAEKRDKASGDEFSDLKLMSLTPIVIGDKKEDEKVDSKEEKEAKELIDKN